MTTSRSGLGAALAALALAAGAVAVWTAVLEPVRIASSSMRPTLEAGDRVWVYKLAFRSREPERGEVVVLRRPEGRSVKRVLGLPGERIDIVDEVVFVDGEPLPVRALGEVEDAPDGRFALLEVTLPERRFRVLDDPALRTEGGSHRVAEGHYFVLGDHRDRSEDSRLWGAISRDDLLGSALGR